MSMNTIVMLAVIFLKVSLAHPWSSSRIKLVTIISWNRGRNLYLFWFRKSTIKLTLNWAEGFPKICLSHGWSHLRFSKYILLFRIGLWYQYIYIRECGVASQSGFEQVIGLVSPFKRNAIATLCTCHVKISTWSITYIMGKSIHLARLKAIWMPIILVFSECKIFLFCRL